MILKLFTCITSIKTSIAIKNQENKFPYTKTYPVPIMHYLNLTLDIPKQYCIFVVELISEALSKKSLKWYDDYLSNQHFTRLIHSLRDLYQDNFRRRPTRNKIQYFWLVRPNIEKMVTVEQMYKDFAVLADAKDKAGEVKMPMLFYTF